ncbi:hypothetical protein AB0M02_27010 [Actinoplanes sp. NPDC051861]|uniref:hypothetical protein n=1 Tax=Actinoplanes sp. NPDC051861 TaxID=3155170 RepID=UPI003428FED7
MFIEVIGPQPLPDDVDRDDVEDLLVAALRGDGEVTGAGSGGSGRWHLDVELSTGIEESQIVLQRLAAALVDHDLGWIVLRPELERVGTAASELA